MTRFRLSCIVALIIGGSSPAFGGVIGGPLLNPANGHYYYLLTANSWVNSENEAITLHGHLATINDADEQQWVFSTFGSYGGVNRTLWIGFNDAVTEGTWRWASGESATYTNWSPGEPNAAYSNEDYAHMWPPVIGAPWVPGQWCDRRSADGSIIYGVVEVLPEMGTSSSTWGILKALYRSH